MSYLREHDEHVDRDLWFSLDVVMVESHLGIIQIEACDQCPILWVRCTHKVNKWNDDGTVLLCRLCGMDGT